MQSQNNGQHGFENLFVILMSDTTEKPKIRFKAK